MIAKLIAAVIVITCFNQAAWSQRAWTDHYKIYNAKTKELISIAQLVEATADADVLFFGEEHDDSIAHRLQDTLYKALLDRYGNVTLSLEMFERDCQLVLDEYLADFITEDRLVKEGRGWSNYKDYRPMVNRAKQQKQVVIAANAPRRYVNRISRMGLASLETLPKASKQYFAKLPIDTVNTLYYQKFSGQMRGTHFNINTYYAQTMWDATMAESIYRYWKKHSNTFIFHLNGRFHTDEKWGTVTQLQRKSKKLSIQNISCFAAKDFNEPDWDGYAQLGDYIIVTDPGVPKSYQ